MPERRTSLVFALASMLALVGLAAWGLATVPGLPPRWLVPIVIVAGLWTYVEWVARSPRTAWTPTADIMRWHRTVFGVIALFLAVKFAARLAFTAEAIDPEWIPLARRSFGITVGLMFTVWGNYLPKLLSPWPPGREPFNWQGVHRFVGRLVTLAGLTVMIVWLVLPLDIARLVSAAVVLGTCLIVVGRKLYSVATWPVERDRPLPGR
ncbi:MAG TPA: hypothetical protein VMM93_05810 [Vicinamibacterales bacterium]|nr:hypothetical protein [Vicinamibacterales bacterium]